MTTAMVIGGGHNGLVAAFYLARAGLKTTLLEARSEIGGGAITSEIHPGFRCPTLTHEVLLQQRIVRDMELDKYGFARLPAAMQVCALAGAGSLVLHADGRRATESIRGLSAKDATAFPDFTAAFRRVAAVLGSTFEYAPPSIEKPDATDLWNLLKSARAFRALGKRDAQRLLRWAPMPIADLTGDWFEHDLVRATIAAPALTGTMLGPRSAGSSLVLLMREAHAQLAGGAHAQVRGGPGAATQALAAAARAAGVDIRTSAPVNAIVVRDHVARGVVANGHTIDADVVVSGVDPKTTLLQMVNAEELSPDFAAKVEHYRAAGTVAKVNLALASLPSFGVDTDALIGRIHIGSDLDCLERAFDDAKYGELSADPWLDVRIPSLLDETLAPRGGHVASIYVHYAPRRLRTMDWAQGREAVLNRTLDVMERHAPGFRRAVAAAQVMTPLDLERDHGLPGGHIFHGELALDQFFTMRPLLGYARYQTPIKNLYLCSAGTHPGGFMTGGSGRLAAAAVINNR